MKRSGKSDGVDLNAAAMVVPIAHAVVDCGFHGASSELLRELADRIDRGEVLVEEINYRMNIDRLTIGAVIDMRGDKQ